MLVLWVHGFGNNISCFNDMLLEQTLLLFSHPSRADWCATASSISSLSVTLSKSFFLSSISWHKQVILLSQFASHNSFFMMKSLLLSWTASTILCLKPFSICLFNYNFRYCILYCILWKKFVNEIELNLLCSLNDSDASTV